MIYQNMKDISILPKDLLLWGLVQRPRSHRHEHACNHIIIATFPSFNCWIEQVLISSKIFWLLEKNPKMEYIPKWQT
jgi:hypothetical protein